jgi:adenylosuccinate lyase
MIERYTLPEMGRIWSEDNKLAKWLEFEILACEALAELGEIPQEAVQRIRKNAKFSAARVKEIEDVTHHDVIAFLTNVAEHIGNDSRYVHLGLTSSDLLDTTLACQIKESGELLLTRLAELRAVVKTRALEHKRTVMVGRTHGIHAEPITFGLKLAVWYDELGRRETMLRAAIDAQNAIERGRQRLSGKQSSTDTKPSSPIASVEYQSFKPTQIKASNGKTYQFTSQKQLDDFRRLTGMTQ